MHNETEDVLIEVANERVRQDEKWGEQNHPNGTGKNWVDEIVPAFGWNDTPSDHAANLAKRATDRAALKKKLTWMDILREEVAEAFAETDSENLRMELIQVAAVAIQWVEAIDRNEKGVLTKE